ncbi:SLC13 family permease [Alloalcanivorax profundimaris]|uniref:SLC13 family permease n=1 Tax=Alloalcanivorax profundimaris TaxID=2735259 RepID=UPI0018893FED|nr:DASS family sodium-coupled anion symporter [Alloalcanivorax profundimaris]MBF1800785.1 DASS family sodium-coupled anion symporter [Alloalcanivorax profundimaris]
MSSPSSSSVTRPGRAAVIGLWLGPLWLIITLVAPPPAGLPDPAWACVGLALLMATWWATEALPIPATALLPLALSPALGITDMSTTAAAYANPVVFLFFGGFLLGLAMQHWHLHRRLALHVLRVVGTQPRRQIGGFMIATGFLSMWVSNTATAIMMLPIGMSVISLLDDGGGDRREVNRYATALLLAIAYSASIGGVATLIGTPPNSLLAGYLHDNQGIELGFAQWMIVGVPISVSMMLVAWWWLTRGGFKLDNGGDSGALIDQELAKMGTISSAEKRVAAIFVLAALAWIGRPFLSSHLGLTWLSDTGIAITAGLLMFLAPSGDGKGERLLTWESARDLPWGVLLLFGGGLSLAAAISGSGLAKWIAEQLQVLQGFPILMIVGLVVLVILFLTEVTSNTATAAAFLPLLGALAVSQDISPLLTTIPAAVAASCAFMMPVATPPNAIVFAAGHMRIQSMIRAGLVLNLIGVVLITLLALPLMKLM